MAELNEQSCREEVLVAVKQTWRGLRFADDQAKADKEIVFEAVRSNGFSLEYADAKLKADKDIVLEAVRQNGWALLYADAKLKADKEVVLEAVKSNGRALQFADGRLKADRKVVLEAVRQDGHALKFADGGIKADIRIVVSANLDKLIRAIRKKIFWRTIKSSLIKKWFYIFLSRMSYWFDSSFRNAYQEYLRFFDDEIEVHEIDTKLHDQISQKVVENFKLAKNTEIPSVYMPGEMWNNIINESEVYSRWQQTSDDNVLRDALYEFYHKDIIRSVGDTDYGNDFDKKLQVYMLRKRYRDFGRQKPHFDLRLINGTDIGKNFYVNCDGRKITFKILHCAYYLNRMLVANLFKGDDPIIGELGSGIGDLTVIAKKILPGCTYVCFDLPTTLMVSSYFIKMTCPELKIGLYEDFVGVKEIKEEDIKEFDIVLLPNWCLEQIQGDLFDIFVNIGSLSEMDPEVINKYVPLIEKITNGYFYTVNRNVAVKEFGVYDVPLDDFPFSGKTEVISKRYDPACDIFHAQYGIYCADLWEAIIDCRK